MSLNINGKMNDNIGVYRHEYINIYIFVIKWRNGFKYNIQHGNRSVKGQSAFVWHVKQK